MIQTIKLTCEQCKKEFDRILSQYNHETKFGQKQFYCSRKCASISARTFKYFPCKLCLKEVKRRPAEICESGNIFCSKVCAAIYNNKHKTKGCRRSKLEVYIETKLKEQFKTLTIVCNSKTAINSELDFYFPSLKLAVELNGIFHYEPIYGKEKLEKIQNNDNRKFQACLERGIELVIIDTSSVKYLKENIALKYYSIVEAIIKSKLAQF